MKGLPKTKMPSSTKAGKNPQIVEDILKSVTNPRESSGTRFNEAYIKPKDKASPPPLAFG